MILLKNAWSLFILAKLSKTGILIGIIWNKINFIRMFKMTNLINIAFLILNIKLAYSAIFLSSYTNILNCYNVFN